MWQSAIWRCYIPVAFFFVRTHESLLLDEGNERETEKRFGPLKLGSQYFLNQWSKLLLSQHSHYTESIHLITPYGLYQMLSWNCQKTAARCRDAALLYSTLVRFFSCLEGQDFKTRPSAPNRLNSTFILLHTSNLMQILPRTKWLWCHLHPVCIQNILLSVGFKCQIVYTKIMVKTFRW